MNSVPDTVLREVLADTSKRLNLAAAFVQATLATLKIETGPKK
jgi:hypothetical protein